MLVESMHECSPHGKASRLNSDVATEVNKSEGGQGADRLNGAEG